MRRGGTLGGSWSCVAGTSASLGRVPAAGDASSGPCSTWQTRPRLATSRTKSTMGLALSSRCDWREQPVGLVGQVKRFLQRSALEKCRSQPFVLRCSGQFGGCLEQCRRLLGGVASAPLVDGISYQAVHDRQHRRRWARGQSAVSNLVFAVELASSQSEGLLGQARPVFIAELVRRGYPAEPNEGSALAKVDRRIPEAGRHGDMRILDVALSKQTPQRIPRLGEQLRRLTEEGHVVIDGVARHAPEHRHEQLVDGVLNTPVHRVTK